jgi:Domain of unknown function (DUF4400)
VETFDQHRGADAAMVHAMQQLTGGLLANPYFDSIDALFLLALSRLSATMEWLPLLGIFALLVTIDGLALRRVRAKELVANSAELFGFSILGASLAVCTVLVVTFIPTPWPPMLLPILLLVALLLMGRALADYHLMR